MIKITAVCRRCSRTWRRTSNPGHRFHPDIGDDDVRLNRIHLFDRFWRGIERENLVTFFPAKCHDDFDHCRLVIDDYDFSHSQRGEYFNFEKKKEETRKNLMSVGDFTMEHDPWNFADKIENCFVNGGRVSKRYSDHICQKILAYFSELMFSPQRPRRINRHHLQGFFRLKEQETFYETLSFPRTSSGHRCSRDCPCPDKC